MALVLLPGLTTLIDDISEEKKLPPQVVEAALREALLKGYERYRRTLYLGISEDPFDEDYFSNFDVGLDLDEEDIESWPARSSLKKSKAKTIRLPLPR